MIHISGPSVLPENGRGDRKTRGVWNWSGLELTQLDHLPTVCPQARSLLPTPGHWFPEALIANIHEPGGLKQRIFILSYSSGGRKSPNQCHWLKCGLPRREVLGENPSTSWWLPAPLACGPIKPSIFPPVPAPSPCGSPCGCSFVSERPPLLPCDCI